MSKSSDLIVCRDHCFTTFTGDTKFICSICKKTKKPSKSSNRICTGCQMQAHDSCCKTVTEDCPVNKSRQAAPKPDMRIGTRRTPASLEEMTPETTGKTDKNALFQSMRSAPRPKADTLFATTTSSTSSGGSAAGSGTNSNNTSSGGSSSSKSASLPSSSPTTTFRVSSYVSKTDYQAHLENAIMDSYRLDCRLNLEKDVAEKTATELELLGKRREELYSTKVQLQQRIQALSKDVKESELGRLRVISELSKCVPTFQADFISDANSINFSCRSFVDGAYSELLKDKTLKNTFECVQAVSDGLPPVVTQEDYDRVTLVRQMLRKLEQIASLEQLIGKRKQLLETDVANLEKMNDSLVGMITQMEATIKFQQEMVETFSSLLTAMNTMKDSLTTVKVNTQTQTATPYEVAPLIIDSADHYQAIIPPDTQVDQSFDDNIEDNSKQIVFIKTEGQLPEVKAGTVNKLVEMLTYDKYPDLRFQQAFLMNYHSFINTPDLVRKLISRYCIAPPEHMRELSNVKLQRLLPIRLRVINVFKAWLDRYRERDFRDPFVCDMTVHFIDNIIAPTGNAALCKGLKNMLANTTSTNEKAMTFSQKIPDPILPYNLKKIDFVALHPQELARQLTLAEHALLRKLEPSEFLKQCWTKPNKQQMAPNICALTAHFNKISQWVIREIVSAQNVSERVSVIIKFLTIAQECRALNNFNSLYEIICALESSAVFRLKKTWETLGKAGYVIFLRLKKFASNENGFHTYREAIRVAIPPLVPYVGVFLTDLIYLDEGNPDMVDGLINFKKLRRFADVVQMLEMYQSARYPLREVPEIIQWIHKLPGITDAEAYEMSKNIEPPELTATVPPLAWEDDDIDI